MDCAVRRDDAYLFIERAASEEHAADQLAFPGGKVENPPDGADALAATARREVREETGVAVEYLGDERVNARTTSFDHSINDD